MSKQTYPRVRALIQEEVKKQGSVNRVSLLTGLTNNTLAKYLEGISEPQQETLEIMSIYFKRPVAWLRGDSDDDTAPQFKRPAEMTPTDVELLAQWEEVLEQSQDVKKQVGLMLAAYLVAVKAE